MSTVINTNLASLFAQNSLSNAQNNLAQSVQRLSSGLRINSAKDDAAGLAISQLMQSHINGTNQAIRNLSDATNLLQTADTSLSTVQDMLLRIKQLSVQGYDGSLSAAQKLNIVTELKDLDAEINATATRTTFNGISLLGSAQGVDSATGDVFAGAFLTGTQLADGGGDITDIHDSGVFLSTPSEKGTVTFKDLESGETVNVGGKIFTAGASDATAAQIAAAFASGTVAGGAGVGAFSGSATYGGNWTAASTVSGTNTVVFTSTAVGNVTDLTVTGTGAQDLVKTQGSDSTTTASYEILGDSGSDVYRMLPGTYTFNSNGDQLTLSATIDGEYKTQTLTVGSALADVSRDNITNQTLDFSNFGIRFQLATTVEQGDQTILGANIAALADGKTIVIDGASAKITDMNVSGAKSGTYTFTQGAAGHEDELTATYVDENGDTSSQTITLLDENFKAGLTSKVEFASYGISMDIHSYQDQDADDIVGLIKDLNNFDLGGATGQLYVTKGSADALKFQSGATSESYIQINTLNIKTDSNSSHISMRSLGDAITALGQLTSSSTTDDWQNAFKLLDKNTDDAIVYLSQERTVFGSQMNRLSYVSTNLQAQSTNLQNSRSAIIDTDFASETAKLTKGQIMQQAATAMLAQANQMPNVILSLLK